MYRCQLCNTVAPPGTNANRVVLETREVSFPGRPSTKRGSGRKGHAGDPGGVGFQIAKEAVVCKSCAEKHASEHASAEM